MPQSAVGLYVQQVDAPRPAAIFNASKPMNPASAIKLVTTFAALDLLGPAYTWKTEAYLLGRLQGDVLDGDLLLKGHGDPKLTVENFWLFLRGLRARGLREIRGDLVLDRSFFDVGEHDPAKFDGEGLRPYNVGADALLVNYKAVRFFFLPSETGQGVSVVPEPKLAQLEVASSVALRDGACGDWRAGLKYELQQNGAGARASFSGSMPSSCGERVWNLAPLASNQYVLGIFKSLWQELGGALAGGVRDGRPPAGAKPFAQFESPAAAEVLRDMNKFSNNVMARQIFLTLSAETLRLPGRYDRSAQTVKSWLEARKLDVPDLVIENGSGLSRADRISPEGMGRMLVAAYHSAVMPEFIATMPLVAYDGTMRKRMRLEERRRPGAREDRIAQRRAHGRRLRPRPQRPPPRGGLLREPPDRPPVAARAGRPAEVGARRGAIGRAPRAPDRARIPGRPGKPTRPRAGRARAPSPRRRPPRRRRRP